MNNNFSEAAKKAKMNTNKNPQAEVTVETTTGRKGIQMQRLEYILWTCYAQVMKSASGNSRHHNLVKSHIHVCIILMLMSFSHASDI